MIDDRTTHLNLPLPHVDNYMDDDVQRMRDALNGFDTAVDLREVKASKGIANGYAGLDGSGKVPAAQLPSFVDDVLEYANLAAFPGTGETGKIYVALDTNKTYRWSGSAYVEISASPGSTDSVTEGSVNLYFTEPRALAAVPIATGSVLGKIKAGAHMTIGGDGTADVVWPNYTDKAGDTLTGPLNEAHGADIASGSTINLTTATGNLVDVTGTTTISSITLGDGAERTVRFTGVLILTNSANLVLPSGANITTAAGDYAVFRGYAGGVVRCVSFTRANGQPLVAGGAPSAFACNHTQAMISLAVAGSQSSIAAVITVDSTRQLIILAGANAIHAVCYDNADGTYGSSALVRTLSANAMPQGILVATDKVLIASCPSGAATFEAVVLSLSGKTITVGTAATATLPENRTGNTLPPVAAGSTYIFGLSCASNMKVIGITVSGTTPTIGTSITALAGVSVPILFAISSSKIAVIAAVGGNVYGIPISVSGTTLTAGTSASAAGYTIMTACALSTGRWAVIYNNTHTRGAIISISGTVASITTVALGSGATLSVGGCLIGDQLVVASEAGLVNVLTDVSGTATAGTAVAANIGANGYANPCGYGSDYVAFAAPTATTTYYSVVKISGNNPVIYDSGFVTSGRVAANGGVCQYGKPYGVLSMTGKSVQISPNSDGTEGAAIAWIFGTNITQAIMPAISTSIFKQSDSVAWSANQPSATALNIRLHRMELV